MAVTNESQDRPAPPEPARPDGEFLRILQSELAGIGALVIAPGGRIRYWNPRLIELWDVPESLAVAGSSEPLLAVMRSRIRIGDVPGTGSGNLVFLANGRVLRRRTRRAEAEDGLPLTVLLFDEAMLGDEFRVALDQTPDAIGVWDQGGQPVFLNRAFEDLFPVGSPWRRAHRPSFGATEDVQLQDGRWLRFSATQSVEGRLISVCQDITAAKRDLATDTARSALWKATLDQIDQGVGVFDSDARLIVVNRRLLELLDLPLELARVGTDLEAIVRRIAMRGGYGQGTPETLTPAYLTLTREGEPHTLEPLRANGPVLDIRGTPLADGGLVLSCTDVSAHKRAEAVARQAQVQAEASNRMKSEFLATMSHELRTPLNAILGFSELMRQQAAGVLPEPYRSYANDIYESGAHLLDLINDILDLSKVEAGRLDIHPEPLDLRRICAASKTLLESRAARAGVEVILALAPDLSVVHADPLRLKQIILNLLSNAIRFSEPGSRVTLAAQPAPGGFELSVADQGIGMTEEELAIALEPFGQVNNSMTRQHEGMGLGLPLARRFVALHGGHLDLSSRKGVGTTVRVFIPNETIESNGSNRDSVPVT